VAPTRSSYEKQQQEKKSNKTKKMNEGVPFFASWTAMTTHKTKGEKNLESVGKLGALENFKRKKKRAKWGEEVGGLWLV
jgi:hypothetical protein